MITGAVLSCTHNQCFEQKNRKMSLFFHLKITIFTAVKYNSILYGRVIVMYAICVDYCHCMHIS